MILYTMVPHELVFQQDVDYSKQSVVNVQGVPLVVEEISPHECKIVRLLSTNPSDFLNGTFSPGQVIQYGLQM